MLLTFDVFRKTQFCYILVTPYFSLFSRETRGPDLSLPPSCLPLSGPFFLGFLLLAFLQQRLLTLKRVFFPGTQICRLCV